MANFSTAWRAFWAIFKNDDKAKAWDSMEKQPVLPEPTVVKQPSKQAAGDEALHLLAILQREARLIDYLEEDLTGYDDATVGSVSRKIHDDCKRTLDKHFHIAPVMDEPEQSQVNIPEQFDARQIKLTGRTSGNPPFTGVLQHRGWKADKVDFPVRNEAQDVSVICPAEVEI